MIFFLKDMHQMGQDDKSIKYSFKGLSNMPSATKHISD